MLGPVSAEAWPLEHGWNCAGELFTKPFVLFPKGLEKFPVGAELRFTFRVGSIDALVEQTTPRTWERYQDCHKTLLFELVHHLQVSLLRAEVIIDRDVNHFTNVFEWVGGLHV